MLRPTVRLLKTLVCPLTLLVLVSVFIYTQDYFTPGYSRWLASNVFPQSPIPTAGEDKDVKEGASCQESESKKSKTGSLYTRLKSPLTLKKSVTSSKGTDSDARAGTISTWDALFSPEYVKRREHAHNACLREGEPAEVQGDVNYVVRFGMTSDAMTPYCGLPESDVLADGSEGGVALNAMTSYCAVPKVACSFWLGVFRYLCNDTNGYHYDSPMSISRTAIHYYDFEKIRFLNRSELHRVADDFRFVFVREPYSRLWSAYVDKLWLPDFWIDTGSIINRELRKKGLSKGHNLCGSNISFHEFVNYVAAHEAVYHNSHWKPIHLQCSPCLYRPHFIGKLETFARDVRVLLSRLNASWIMDEEYQSQHVHSEVRQLITYNYDIVNRDSYKNCTNSTIDLPRRLWAAFQYSGYISTQSKYPFEPGQPISKKSLKMAAKAAVEDGKGKTKADWRQQREAAMLDAYEAVSTETLVKLRDTYWMDFVLYDYDPEPPTLFRGRKYRHRTFRGDK